MLILESVRVLILRMLLLMDRWHNDKSDPREMEKCTHWLAKHLAVDDLMVLPAAGVRFMKAEWPDINVRALVNV